MVNLCLGCRKASHKISGCPTLDPSEPNSEVDHIATELLLDAFAHLSDWLCERCARFRIIRWLPNEDIKDEVNRKHNADQWLGLGPLHSIVLDASCPLCRMILKIFPSIPTDDQDWRVELALDEKGAPNEDLGKKCDIYVMINSRQSQVSVLGRYFGDFRDQMVHGFESVFVLSRTAVTARPWLSARERRLTRCEKEHSTSCRVEWSDQLLLCKMIDVSSRQIVSCPPQCRYIALSYVCGDVSPKPGPQTIEDSIGVTKALGLRYLWVDALCIDQTPSPENIQQLNMMDLIYSCSWESIVALHSDSADTGLCGLSEKNPVVSSRRILFGKHQIHFMCNAANCCESIDDASDPGGVLDKDRRQRDFFLLAHREYVRDPVSRRAFADTIFRRLVEMDMLSFLQKTMLPQGFVWRLPLEEFPQWLTRYHPRVIRPRRRPDFLSWSYVGLNLVNGGASARFDETVDLVLSYVGIEDKNLAVHGILLKLEVRNEPFNNAYIPETDFLVGGVFDFLVVERLSFRYAPEGSLRHILYMIMLDRGGEVFSRRAMVRLYVEPRLEERQE
ncbi:HET-domain-containing protein [Hypoxylon sp. FL0890]|nr:HET-domain-containing protein [Hypoxylon sp. FL0890]